MASELKWPLSSVVYHIYPRSLFDTNSDGIGDLKGIEKKLDYLVDLGINAIWISPIYRSPMKDFGYDISDHADVDSIFGNMKNFDSLIKNAHRKNIKVMIDYVPNHTSDQHKWFEESRSSKDNPKRDWYIWAQGKADGSPPNNWRSYFGGSAWQLDAQTNEYYLHTFDKHQPDLNWRNPELEKAMLEVLKFWLQKGVDGFRVDAIDWVYKDPSLRDEPHNPNRAEGKHSEYDHLIHTYTFSLPETIEVMKKFVKVVKQFDHKFIVAEAHLDLQEIIKRYVTVGWKWYQPFNFSLIYLPWKAEIHKQYIDEYDKALGELYVPCFVLGNHDQHRVGTRIGIKQARIAAILQLTLRGLPFIYYGEEIGMTDNHIPSDQIQDTYEINSPKLGFGRDPERTPMQWDDGKYAGFSSSKPWLPINPNYTKINVRSEEKDPKSMLTLYKLLIRLKKGNAVLREGKYVALPMPADNVLAFIREHDGNKILVLLNFDDRDKKISMNFKKAKIICEDTLTDKPGKIIDLTDFKLEGNEGYILQI
jgi:alpha-glucosidase